MAADHDRPDNTTPGGCPPRKCNGRYSGRCLSIKLGGKVWSPKSPYIRPRSAVHQPSLGVFEQGPWHKNASHHSLPSGGKRPGRAPAQKNERRLEVKMHGQTRLAQRVVGDPTWNPDHAPRRHRGIHGGVTLRHNYNRPRRTGHGRGIRTGQWRDA